MGREGELVVDYTTLRAVSECSTKAAMGSVLALQSRAERLPLDAGIGCHAALAQWLETGDVDEALQCLRDYYQPIWARASANGAVDERLAERLAYPVVERVLRHWLTTWTRDGFPYTLEVPGMTEIAVTRDLGDGVTYVALIDAVVRSKVGGRWFLDWKTTGSLGPWWDQKQEDSGQFTGQRWAADSLGEVEGVVVGGIGLTRLNSSHAKCRDHGVPYKECALQHLSARVKTVTTTDAEIRAYAETVTHVVKKYRRIVRQVQSIDDVPAQPMEGRLNGACGFCDYRGWCRMGRPTAARIVDKAFEARRWDPLAEAQARRVRSKKEGVSNG